MTLLNAPASIFDKVSTSSIRCRSRAALRSTVSSIWSWASVSGPGCRSRSISTYPAMLVSGVRSSWDTVARKSDLVLSTARSSLTRRFSASYSRA